MKKIMQRVFGVLTSVALLVTSATPVFATSSGGEGHSHSGGVKIEDTTGCDYTITLTHSNGDSFDSTNSHYGAYQIFSGVVKGKKDDGPIQDPGGNSEHDSETIPITDVKWGNAFGILKDKDATNGVAQSDIDKKIVGFVIALAKAPKGEYSYAFSDFNGFEGFVKGSGANTYLDDKFLKTGETADVNENSNSEDLAKVDYDKLAVAVADVLAEDDHINDHEWLQAFTDILGGYAQSTTIVGSYAESGYVDRFYEGEIDKSNDKQYKITVPAGYYMIRDLSSFEGETDESYSARMLFVANNVAQVLKEDVPTLEKKIVRSDGEHETEVAGVGDEVKFRLTGTLPGNYNLYLGGYQYKFTDKLSDGLTLKEKEPSTGTYVTVTVKNVYDSDGKLVEGEYEIDKTTSYEKGTHITHADMDAAYTEEYKDNVLTVSFPCLKEIQITVDGKKYTLGVKSEIYIDYTAVVNKDAIVNPAADGSNNGNTNDATITYSDNPQSYGDTDETKEDHANVYVFGIDIVKIDAAEFLRTGSSADAALQGAKFALVRPIKNGGGTTITGWEIASFEKVAADPSSTENLPDTFKNNGYYTITEWDTIVLTGVGDVTKFDSTWLDKAPYNNDLHNITTPSNGVINISGLDVDVEYTMVETDTPKGPDGKELYAKIDPFTFTLKTEQDPDTHEYNGKLSSATVSPEVLEGQSFDFKHYVQLLDPKAGTSDDNGSASMLVANFKYIDLPSTGGVGTYLFYIIGGGIVVLSAVLFILSKKKTTK